MKRRMFLKLPALVLAAPVLAKAAESVATDECKSAAKAYVDSQFDRPLQYIGRPTSAVLGDMYHDLSTDCIMVYNGTKWLPVLSDKQLQTAAYKNKT